MRLLNLPDRFRRGKKHARPLPGPESIRRLELPDLPRGRGRAHAPIIWLALASHLRWSADGTDAWASNATLAGETGCPTRAVEYAIAMLRRAGKISVRYGARGRYGYGRIITLHLLEGPGGNPKVDLPSPADMAALWDRARGQRERPATLVALGVALHVVTAAHNKGKVGKGKTVRPKLAQLQRLVGASAGQTFTARLDALAASGVILRAGEYWRDGIEVFGQLAIRALRAIVQRVEPVLLAPVRMVSCSDQGRLAEMSEAFARMYA